jgi:hypothetical protein
VNDRVILAVKYTPVGAPGAVRRAVGGFLRYVQYRDKHADQAPPKEVDGMLKYVAHRDRTGSRARLFDASGPVGDDQRRALAAFVGRGVAATKAQLSRSPGGPPTDRRRAVYRFVLSPEHADGLDLRRLSRAAMERLADDAGGGLRWIAAEHRNTQHPHVHIVLSGFRETASGEVRGLVLTKPRLARMKEALALDIERQRGPVVARPEPSRPPSAPRRRLPESPRSEASRPRSATRRRPRSARRLKRSGSGLLAAAPSAHRHPWVSPLRRLAARYRWQTEQLAEQERRRLDAESRARE